MEQVNTHTHILTRNSRTNLFQIYAPDGLSSYFKKLSWIAKSTFSPQSLWHLSKQNTTCMDTAKHFQSADLCIVYHIQNVLHRVCALFFMLVPEACIREPGCHNGSYRAHLVMAKHWTHLRSLHTCAQTLIKELKRRTAGTQKQTFPLR